MKKSLFAGLLAGFTLSVAGFAANAAVVDVIESPTGFFVPTDAEKYNSPYYRGYGEDWSWTHNAIGGVITDATLQISAFDVDFAQGENDGIYAYDNGIEIFLGYLIGENDAWAFTDFVLGANFFDDIANGLQILIKIDEGDDEWFVTLAKSALQINGNIPQNPNPGQVPEPLSLALMGLGLASLAVTRRRQSA